MPNPTSETENSVSTKDNMVPLAYVSMSPGPDLEPVYFKVIKPVLENHGLICKRNENRSGTGIISGQVLEYIDAADLVLCDVTHRYAPTYYELGISHAFCKTTILISQETADIPFNTRYQRVLSYKDDRFGLLELRDALSSTLSTLYPEGTMYSAGGYVSNSQSSQEAIPVTVNELEEARTALFHHSVDAKRYAVRFLGNNQDRASYDRIRWLINNESESAELVRDALTALYEIDSTEALKDLLGKQGIWHKSLMVRERVVSLIGNYPKSDLLIKRLIDQISDTSWGVRVAVCQQLGKWGATQAKSVLQQRRVDPDQPVRVAAEEALYKIIEAEQERKDRGSISSVSKFIPRDREDPATEASTRKQA